MKYFFTRLISFFCSSFFAEILYGFIAVFIFKNIPEKFSDMPFLAFQAYGVAATFMAIIATFFFGIFVMIVKLTKQQPLGITYSAITGIGTIIFSNIYELLFSILFSKHLVDATVSVFTGFVTMLILWTVYGRVSRRYLLSVT